jgi:putative membrane-bound dehydrogenase-like protein
MGREIAQTMHFSGAEWLIRETRESEEAASELLALLGVEPGMTVCDLGCGNGYHTLPIARKVGKEGRVLAVDIQPEMLEMLEDRAAREGIENIEPILGDLHDPHLPKGEVDLVLLVDVYHEFSHPELMLRAIRDSLAPGGRVALVEFRAEDPKVPIKPLHKMSKEQILKEYLPNGFELVGEVDVLPWQHLMFFGKAALQEKEPTRKSEVLKKSREPFAYLEEDNPLYPGLHFPKLITPQWIGEEGVEAAIILAIDDLGPPEKYETYLRPILDRLKQIDGRAPVSIMANKVDPGEPLLQKWLSEGVTIETHTTKHACPMMHSGDLAAVKEDYDRCVDLMASIPNNRPVAFRVPCCDSMNATNPRFFTEIFSSTTENGNFMRASSSVFQMFTSDDPDLPRELVQEEDGSERFEKYLPTDRVFSNVIENYPYPYILSNTCWEFPAVIPSDWEAQHYQRPNNPFTVEDWKAALDATVIKQGVFTLCFHPHGWIENTQVVEFIDYAVHKYGDKIKFLNFREAVERLEENLFDGTALRSITGLDSGSRLIDLNRDGYLDAVVGGEAIWELADHGSLRTNLGPCLTRLWNPEKRDWTTVELPLHFPTGFSNWDEVYDSRFAKMTPSIVALYSIQSGTNPVVCRFAESATGVPVWIEDPSLLNGLQEVSAQLIETASKSDTGLRFRDLDGDGATELIDGGQPGGSVYRWVEGATHWEKLPIALPEGVSVLDASGRDAGLRFVDLNEDGLEDIVFSNEARYSVYLLTGMETGWSVTALSAERSEENDLVPSIVREGRCNGVWFADRTMWISNEDTAKLPGHVGQVSYNTLLADSKPFGTTAKGALHGLHLPPGFDIEQVAAEPLTRDPVALDWGPDGKLWVVEMADYSAPEGSEEARSGRVRFLEDTDGDGVYDTSTLFLSGLDSPSGVMAYKKGALVASTPDIFYAVDTDGDGEADYREPLYTGFGAWNQQHLVNGFRWGLDNWIYLANGDSGGDIRSVSTGAEIGLRGRDLRIRPETGEMETLYGQTQFGRERDDWDNWFGCNNPNPMWHYALLDRYISRNPHVPGPSPKVDVSDNPGPSPCFPVSRTVARFNDLWMVNRFTSCCGVSLYRDFLLGEGMHDNSFVCEPVHNLVHREVVSPEGVTFTSHRAQTERRSEFLASSDNWFRPAMTRTGPDGALWVVDMNRAQIEHPQFIPEELQEGIDFLEGDAKGRIYRIFPADREPRPIRRLDTLSEGDLVEILRSPNGIERDLAHRLLIDREAPEIVARLESLVGERGEGASRYENAVGRTHALGVLDARQALSADLLELALEDPHPGVRRHAVRLSVDFLEQSEALREGLVKLAEDEDAFVRLQVAYTLGEKTYPGSGKALGRFLVANSTDTYLTAAGLSSLSSDNLVAVVESAVEATGKEPIPEDLLSPLAASCLGYGKPEALDLLIQSNLQDAGQEPTSSEWSAVSDLLAALDKAGRDLSVLSASGESSSRKRVEELIAMARDRAKDFDLSTGERVQSVSLFGHDPEHAEEEVEILAALLDPIEERALQDAAIESVGRFSGQAVPKALLANWSAQGPEIRSKIVSTLLSRADWLESLMKALEAGDIAPVEISAAQRQSLLDHEETPIAERAREIFSEQANPDREKAIAAFQTATELEGDALHGKEIFARICASCHALGGEGRALGPDLAALSDKSPEALLVHVLDPNRTIETKFLSYIAETYEGEIVTGLLTEETGNSITLAGADGEDTVILRRDLNGLRSTDKSFMPEGLEADLDPQDLADLFAYVGSGGRSGPIAGGKVIQPEKFRGEIWLLAPDATLSGESLKLESTFNNLGGWTHPGALASWRFQVTEEMDYMMVMDYACAANPSGNRYTIKVSGSDFSGEVEPTGDLSRYDLKKLGWLHLTPGEYQLTVKAEGPLEGPLMNLKGVGIQPGWMHGR